MCVASQVSVKKHTSAERKKTTPPKKQTVAIFRIDSSLVSLMQWHAYFPAVQQAAIFIRSRAVARSAGSNPQQKNCWQRRECKLGLDDPCQASYLQYL